MQREIKFRAWDGKRIHSPCSVYACIKFDQHRDWPLMQFTGLKDKNGGSIYEGDIVKFCVESDMYKGNVEWDEKFGRFVIRHKDFLIAFEHINHLSTKTEVIGNVYEHPHLLTPKDSEKV